MMLRWVALVVVVVSLAQRTTASEHNVTEMSQFCKTEPHGYTCTFLNTTQNVVVGSGSEISQHPAGLCTTNLDKSSNAVNMNITVGKDKGAEESPSPNRTLAYVTTDSTSSAKSKNVKSRRGPARASLQQGQGRDCEVKISVQNSFVHWVQGHFVEAKFNNSRVTDIDGDYMHLDLKNTSVTNMSLSGKIIEMEDSHINLINELKVEQSLLLSRTSVGTVAPYSLHLQPPPGRDEPHQRYIVRDVTVQRLEEDSVKVAGAKVMVTNTSVNWMARDAVTVQANGMLTLTHVVFHNDAHHCLKLERGSRLIVRNVTIRGNIIHKMDLAPIETIYPLSTFALNENEGLWLMPASSWYWVVIMIACGVVAGMVIGSALMWRRPSLRNGPTSTLTLSDLLSHDRLQQQENNTEAEREHGTDHTIRPNLTRQDSGLTSSSFESFMHSHPSKIDVELGTSRGGYSNAVKDVT